MREEMAQHVHKFEEKDKATFYSPTEVWSLPATSPGLDARAADQERSEFS